MAHRNFSTSRSRDEQPDNAAILQTMQQLLALQQEHNELMRATLEAANRAAAGPAPEPLPPMLGTVTDFMRLHPDKFSGTETPLEAEQWLIRTEKLLIAAQVADVDRVDMVSIQLVDLAHIWWRAETERLDKPIEWATFTESFMAKFFPSAIKAEMERQFVFLTQGNRSVDEYAAEFTRFSHFAPALVATDEDRARRFLMGLSFDIQDRLATLRLRAFADVLDAARIQEQTLRRMGISQRAVQHPVAVRPTGGPIRRPVLTHPVRAQPYAPVSPMTVQTCDYCHKVGHSQRDCRALNRLCLACGSSDHMVRDCPRNKAPAPIGGVAQQGTLARGQGRLPLPLQRQVFDQRRVVPRGGQTGGRDRAYNLTTEEAEAAIGVVADEVFTGVDGELPDGIGEQHW